MKRIRYRISPKKYLPECLQYKIDRRAMLDYDHNIERHFLSSRTPSQEVSLSQKISMKRRRIRVGLRILQNPLLKDFRIQVLRTLRIGQAAVVCKICSSSCQRVTREPIFFVVTWAKTRWPFVLCVYITYIACITYISNALMPWWYTSSWAMPRSFSYWTIWRCCPACYFSTYWPSPASSQPTTWPRCFY